MTAILNYFGFGGSASPAQENSAVRALPASWYTSQEMYDLERRAIFARKWLLITHKVRLERPGDYLRYETANFQLILCRDRDGNVNGFHNTCGYCANPVVSEQKGTTEMFVCEDHGWSYGLDGKLINAPGHQYLEEFDWNTNHLHSIHIHIDCNGFIWVNLDSKQTPEIGWDVDFAGIDTQERFSGFDFDDYSFDHEWEMEGAYNWKILADNYNECYHCATTHPDLKEMADLETYSVTTKDGYILHNVRGRPGGEGEKAFKVHPTYYFPSTSMNVSPHFLFLQRFVPQGPVKSTMRYEVYRSKYASEAEFQAINQMYKRVMSEDKALCEASQKNLNAGIFVNGEMHPRLEQGPLFFQKKCRDTVVGFHKREQAAKKRVWPIRQTLQDNAEISQPGSGFSIRPRSSSQEQFA